MVPNVHLPLTEELLEKMVNLKNQMIPKYLVVVILLLVKMHLNKIRNLKILKFPQWKVR